MSKIPDLGFWKLWNISFGFFGVQIAYALQSANISRIFSTLGADPHDLSYFWILPPLAGIIVQPIIGAMSSWMIRIRCSTSACESPIPDAMRWRGWESGGTARGWCLRIGRWRNFRFGNCTERGCGISLAWITAIPTTPPPLSPRRWRKRRSISTFTTSITSGGCLTRTSRR